MNRSLRTIVWIIAAILTGWMAGRAQTANPDFELVVSAPGGETSIECVRGCDLRWVERGLNPSGGAIPKFTFRCGASQCSSGRVGGWLRR
jgi:hypothetical protein